MFHGHAALLASFLLVDPLITQSQPNPETGGALFRANCAFCHGSNAMGGRGPNLLGKLSHSDQPQALQQVIKDGIPGTAMPGNDFEPEEVADLLAYLKTLRQGKGSATPVPGDPQAGRAVYAKQGCSGCHMINRDGSAFGPDLSRVGVARSYDYLKDSIVKPSADIPAEFRSVRVTTAEGKTMSGILVNEDTFSLQLRLLDQSYRSFDKAHVKFDYPNESLMPPYILSDTDLANLLAYLTTLSGDPADAFVNPAADPLKAQGVH
jgi:cytochrome c oxidase cbb3-type subunit III